MKKDLIIVPTITTTDIGAEMPFNISIASLWSVHVPDSSVIKGVGATIKGTPGI